MKNSITPLALFASSLIAVTAQAWSPAKCPGSGSSMLTEWGARLTPETAWRAYPRPQLVRPEWTCLNGLWEYAVQKLPAGNALDRPDAPPARADGRILVPFAIESPLSGVGRLMEANELLWYRRTFTADPRPGTRLLLHFESVDQRAQVFVNDVEATDVPHVGMLPFSLDVTDLVKPGANKLTVLVWDPTDGCLAATGKQTFKPHGCMYTRASGIMGTVWLETVPETHLTGYTVTTDIDAGTVSVTLQGAGNLSEAEGRVEVRDGDRVLAQGEMKAWGRPVTLALPRPLKLWSPDTPYLYSLRLTLKDDETDVTDVATGYFGLRKIEKRKDARGTWRFFVNNEPVFLQGPLDQGWWPDGFLTPPSDEAMAFDIKTLKSLGCNMMRKHIKVEPRRYYWLCDTLGLMIVQDQPSGWGDVNRRYAHYRTELKGMLDLLQAVPSIVMWCPYNEGWGQPWHMQTRNTLLWTKRYDPTRLVNGPSGWDDYEGGDGWRKRPDGKGNQRVALTFTPPSGYVPMADTIDMHNYRGPGMHPVNPHRISFLGEFGGLGHAVSNHLWSAEKSWGYGGTDDTATRAGLQKTYLDLMGSLATLAFRGLAGSVYTQTTDVELEINGYLTYDRRVLKFDAAALRAAHRRVYDMAKLGATTQFVTVPVLPRGATWAYTNAVTAADWMQPGFDDASWARGAAGFGGGNIDKTHPAAKVVTPWNTKELYLRTTFTWNASDRLVQLGGDIFHDEDVVFYLNGQEVFSAGGFTTSYKVFGLDAVRCAAALKPGVNTLAVRVKQTVGGQYFDCSLTADVAK